MSKYVCSVCGYVHEGDQPPKECPQCKAPASKFVEQGPEMSWAAEHVVGVAQGAPEDIMEDLRANFNGECTEVGMYLAMSRVAYREGYPEIGEYWRRAAFEEAEHAAKFAELLGEVVTDSTKKNLEMRVEAENGATAGKVDLATRAMARYMPTSEHSPSKFMRRSLMISSETPCATPTTCSAAQVMSPACSTNFSAGAPQTGHF